MQESKHRIVIVNRDKCKPNKCGLECKKICPLNKTGKICVNVSHESKMAEISEEMCIGCGICVKKCPFKAIQIINLPVGLESETAHRYGKNQFKLHRLPIPRPGSVLGLVGTNGIGKSTALQILAGKIVPNLGNYESPPKWTQIIKHYRGSELQTYFTKLVEDNIRAIIKPQYVDSIPKYVKGKLAKIIEKKDQRKVSQKLLKKMELEHLLDRDIQELSGGELQRFANMLVMMQNVQVFLFDEPSSFLDMTEAIEVKQQNIFATYKYQQIEKRIGNSFRLVIQPGQFNNCQITVLVGENGTGKTTFLRIMARIYKDTQFQVPDMNVSYKPQKIAPKFQGTVRELLNLKLTDYWKDVTFTSEVTKPLKLDDIIDQEVQKLSGGELQRVAIILALGKAADVYMLDEPSAYLDAEQRIITAKVIKRFILNNKKAALIVEHDFIMATYLADQVIVFEGKPGFDCVANSPQNLISGMNKFLSILDRTFRRDPNNFRPRINKLGSVKDREQKKSGNYFCVEE